MVNVLPENETDCSPVCPSRRAVVTAAAGGAAAVLAGCSSYGDSAGNTQPVPDAEDTGGVEDTGGSNAGADDGDGEGGDGEGEGGGVSLASLEDVPVGGGLILEDQKIVVTRPSKGRVRAFTTECTHQGCAVSEVTDGNILCTCHGSAFAILDGAPTDGPAKKPLKKVKVKVDGDKIVKA